MKLLNLILIIVSGSIMINRLIKYHPYSNWSLIIIFIFGFLTLFFLILFLFNNEIKKKFLITFVSIFLTIFFINPFLSLYTEKNDIYGLRYKAAKKANLFYDKRNRLEVIKDLKKENQEAFPVIPPTGFYKRFKNKYKILPLGGISNVLTVHCNENGKWSIYKSDSYGFNNKKFFYSSKNKKKILIIGDSFAQGACVKQENTLAGQLNKINIEAKSLGMDGNGPIAALATIREYAKIIKPEYIIWILHDNDIGDLQRELGNVFLKNYLNPDFNQNLINKKTEINILLKNVISKEYIKNEDKIRNFLNKCFSLFYIRKLIGFNKFSFEKLDKEDKKELYKDLKKVIYLMKNESEKISATLKIVYVPDILQFDSKEHNKKDSTYLINIEEIKKIIKISNVEWLNFYEIMLDSEKPQNFYPFKLKGHFTPEGYKTLAKQIESFIQ